ncbi:MAG: hypothetical protein IKD46_02210 [Lentisphaeria bacterium]|nr:hypothetical protein [Lentisphaeria bacterium]
MSEKVKALSYFPAMAGCFRGTAVFQTLIGHSMLRTIWHAVLTVLLLGIATAVVQVVRMDDSIRESLGHFQAEFGGVTVSEEQGVIPAVGPGKSHYLLLNRGGILVYAPAGKMPVLPEKASFRDFRYGIVWYPAGIVLVMPTSDEDRYVVNTMSFGEKLGDREMCDEAGLQKILQKAKLQKWDDPDALEQDYKFGFSEIEAAVKWVAGVGYFGIFFFEAVSQILMCLLIFVGFFALTSGRNRTLKWGELVRIALYAGCPALAVAACFMALDLTEILGFGTVYVIGTIGFFLVIVNKIEQSRHAGQA